jgi:uncharacterized protein YdhG (YjbR/CyaY superfamily)
MSSKKSNPVDQYISGFPEETRKLLELVRESIRKVAGDAEETINYGIPTFKLNGRNLVHYAAFKKHIGFYPGTDGIAAFKAQISDYKSAKGSVQFPLDRPMPLGLIEDIVKYRMQQEAVRTRLKKSK